MRFFYRIAQEEPRLEAPPHDRPSTPGLGASLPPADSTLVVDTNEIKTEKEKPEINDTTKSPQIKSPIKILKNSEGCYEVLKSPASREQAAPVVTKTDPKVAPQEFSVVSIGDGQNSNGVKITLKQCSPSSLTSKKPKVISNVLLRRCPVENEASKAKSTEPSSPVEGNETSEKEMKTDVTKEKEDAVDSEEKQDQKQKRKVTFVDTPKTPVKLNGENNIPSKKPADLQDKKQFLQSFQLTARETKVEPQPKNPPPPTPPPPKIDVYAFPSDPPLPPGAVKRKCPPGLPIFEAKRRKLPFTTPPKKLTVKPLNRINKTSQQVTTGPNNNSTSNSGMEKKSPVNQSPPQGPVNPTNVKSSPNLYSNTRNLLDGCGLNIPASLSITLTAPKSPNNSQSPSSDPGHSKDNNINMLNKVNPSITLNDRSVDPRVLKALKTGQIRMPAPTKMKPPQTPREIKISPKRKKDQDQLGEDALDLSGGKKMDIHPLRIPQPISKPKGKSSAASARENNVAQSQLVTVVGGQRYYRAPPGSLTPAAHRVSDLPMPATSRTPVYAPSCLPSPTSSGRSSSLSSVFPSLQSLYALSQAQNNRQQLQIEARLRLPQSDANSANSPSKSHLAAQCAPIKPARSSVTSLAVPIIKQANNTTLPCEGTLR